MNRRRTGKPDTQLPTTTNGICPDRLRIDGEAEFRITDDTSADAEGLVRGCS